MQTAHYIRVADSVREALDAHRPVVALESTIISHGMPYPDNVATALTVENDIRERGAVPATVAVLDGVIRVGLSPEEIERIGHEGLAVTKTSRRDIPYVLATGKTGSMTVAASMIAAHLAGIRFFATGGTGGVHRHGETTMDISADLEELARTPVCVISAGVKSILDIGRTLEYLETKGVPVVGYRTDEMPAFFARSSGHRLVARVDTPGEVARMVKIAETLDFSTGMIIANPIPEAAAMPHDVIDRVIEAALDEADRRGIRGKGLSPFLLERITRATEGSSLRANIALIRNNARVAADIAGAYATL
ncbi:MAG: pseudouridine-5'-phosphate glycosidase [Saccharofermentanales bacterium]|jgi:pseudouridine-5'-phosphate glycosidase